MILRRCLQLTDHDRGRAGSYGSGLDLGEITSLRPTLGELRPGALGERFHRRQTGFVALVKDGGLQHRAQPSGMTLHVGTSNRLKYEVDVRGFAVGVRPLTGVDLYWIGQCRDDRGDLTQPATCITSRWGVSWIRPPGSDFRPLIMSQGTQPITSAGVGDGSEP